MSKGNQIMYGDVLSTQPYLLPNNIFSVEDKEELFSYRCRMNLRKYNFPGNTENEICICGQSLTNEHLYYCYILRCENSENSDQYHEYNKIFNGTLHEQKEILNILRKHSKQYEKHTQSSVVEPHL